jgi:hypothetical protein
VSEDGRWVPIEDAVYRESAVFCRVTGVRLQRRYWRAADGSEPYASSAAVALDRRVDALRERWPEAARPDVGGVA